MTLISSIIQDAYRETNMLPLGVVPNTNQTAEALRLYNAVLNAIYGDDAGEMLQDWPLGNFGRQDSTTTWWTVTDRQNPRINSRLIAVNDDAMTVYLTPWPQDGSRMGLIDPFSRLATYPVTLDANGRTIDGNATLLVDADVTFSEWLYRADLGNWVQITQKIESDENPFPIDFDNFFVTLLALRLSPRYGRMMDDQSLAIFKSERKKFVARYLQSQPLLIDDSLSWPFMSTQSYDSNRAFNTDGYQFNSGGYWNRGW